MVLRCILLALVLAVFADLRDAGASERFLGRDASSVVDPTGRWTVQDLAGDLATRFAEPDGGVANHGVAPTADAVLWLRFTVPVLGPEEGGRFALSLEETRVRVARLYVPDRAGFRMIEWRRGGAAEPREELRFPVFLFDAAEISGRTLHMAVETRSSMRAMLWLRTPAAFAAAYGTSGLYLGILVGALTGLSVYLLSLGTALRDRSLTALGALAIAFVIYAAADRALIETTLLPGSDRLSRVLSLSATFAIFAAWIAFANHYLCVADHRPWLARAAGVLSWLLIALAADAALEAALDLQLLRLYSPYLGLASLAAGFGIAALMLPRERARATAFLVCWAPAVAGGTARLGLDAFPGLDATPAVVNAVFIGAGFSILVFGLITSLDIQARERRLRQAAEFQEARFRDFARTASDSFWETGNDGRVKFASGPASRALDLAPGTALVERLGGAAEGGSRAAVAGVEEAFRRATAFHAVPLAASGEGGIRHFLLSGAPAADGSGWRGTLSDVTAERERLDREALQRKMAALGQLAGGMAHELNNLLHPIINLGRRLRDRPDAPKDWSRLAGIIVDAGQRAGEIVAGVLTTVRTGTLSGPPMPVAEAVRRSLDAIRPAVPAGVRLDDALADLAEPELPPGEVLQVLSNLIANAVQAVGGSGHVTVALGMAEEGSDVVLSVVDDGEGMDAETRQRAVEPFFTTRPPSRGTGLGLPIVTGVVRGWGGSVEIRSELGLGTTIMIRLPPTAGRKPRNRESLT